MKKYRQSKDELAGHLGEQINFIVESAVSFDKGFQGEAKRLAVAIRILVYDTARSSALLTQLRKMSILFYDSASIFDPGNLLPSNCLTMIRFSKQEGEEPVGDYVAPLDRLSGARNKNKKVGFNRWWNSTTMYKDRTGNIFTRKDLVLTVANKEGGAHIDPELDEAYANLSRFNSLGWRVFTQGKDKGFENSPVLPSIRQIAHEVMKTLRDEAVDLFPQSDPIVQKFDEYEKHCKMIQEA